MIARRLVVRGDVQGVGYRYSAVMVAQDAGVAGWVRNCSNGTVEAHVQGDVAAVEAFVAWCRRGPPAARVAAVDVATVSVDGALTTFETRPTLRA